MSVEQPLQRDVQPTPTFEVPIESSCFDKKDDNNKTNENTMHCSVIEPEEIEGSGEMTSNSIDLGKPRRMCAKPKSDTLNVERNIKTLLRLLRKSVKRHFDNCHKKKHYYWNDKNLRLRTLKFFTEALDVPTEFYCANEEAFFKLVHNTKEIAEDDEVSGSCMKHMAITELFKEVFG